MKFPYQDVINSLTLDKSNKLSQMAASALIQIRTAKALKKLEDGGVKAEDLRKFIVETCTEFSRVEFDQKKATVKRRHLWLELRMSYVSYLKRPYHRRITELAKIISARPSSDQPPDFELIRCHMESSRELLNILEKSILPVTSGPIRRRQKNFEDQQSTYYKALSHGRNRLNSVIVATCDRANTIFGNRAPALVLALFNTDVFKNLHRKTITRKQITSLIGRVQKKRIIPSLNPKRRKGKAALNYLRR